MKKFFKKFFKKFISFYVNVFNDLREARREILLMSLAIFSLGSPVIFAMLFSSGWFLLLYIIFIPILSMAIDIMVKES